MKQWVKLWVEINRDPALYRLPEDCRLIFFHCLALAGEIDHKDEHGRDTGWLGTIPDIAFRIRYDEERVREAVKHLIACGIAEIDDQDVVYLRNYAKRQAVPVSSTREAWRDRKQRQREAERMAEGLPERITDERLGQLRDLLESRGVEVKSLLEAGLYQQLLKSAGPDLFNEAVDEAMRTTNSGRVSYGFLKGIIERCQQDGCRPGEWSKNTKNYQAPQVAEVATPTAWYNPVTGQVEGL